MAGFCGLMRSLVYCRVHLTQVNSPFCPPFSFLSASFTSYLFFFHDCLFVCFCLFVRLEYLFIRGLFSNLLVVLLTGIFVCLFFHLKYFACCFNLFFNCFFVWFCFITFFSLLSLSIPFWNLCFFCSYYYAMHSHMCKFCIVSLSKCVLITVIYILPLLIYILFKPCTDYLQLDVYYSQMNTSL